jgi:hypothetical protein
VIVIYDPRDGTDPVPYDADELTCGEADAVCRATDMQWPEVGQALRQQSPGAMRAVAWAWRKRADPTLRLAAFDPPLKALKARFSTEEIPDFIRQLDRAAISPEERAQGLREIVDFAVDPEAAAKVIEAEDGPKDPVSP